MAVAHLSAAMLVFVFLVRADITAVEVHTTFGPVRGVVVSGSLRFLGIPYARAPLGPRRFRPPEPPEPWTDVRNATSFGDICMQFETLGDLNMSEDCLNLNIYIPGLSHDLRSTKKRAVMVYIVGGGWTVGTGSRFDLGPLSMQGDIIGVTFNYRKGILGFLTSGDDEIKGNAGLLDQVMALSWIQKNIENFGGDKNRVTIFGLNAGGWSVSAHVLSPMSRGLFQRAISQSGVLDRFPLPHYTSQRDKILRYVSGIGCNVTSTATMLSCLTSMEARDLQIADILYSVTIFSAVEDGYFFPHSLPDLWRNFKNPDGVEYLAGLSHDDGDIMLIASNSQFQTSELQLGISEERFNSLVGSVFTVSNAIPYSQRDVIYDQYAPVDSTNMTRLRAAIDLFRDAWFLAPTITALDSVSISTMGRAYLYYFQHKTPAGKRAALESYRAGHRSDRFYIFGWVSEELGYDEEDKILSDTMMDAWTSFAKYGKPRVQLNDTTVLQWPQYDATNRTYLAIQYPMTLDSVQHRLLPRATSFWNVLAPALSYSRSYDHIADSICPEDSPSRIGRNEAETALFILIAVVIVLLLATAILLANYCSLKKTKTMPTDKGRIGIEEPTEL